MYYSANIFFIFSLFLLIISIASLKILIGIKEFSKEKILDSLILSVITVLLILLLPRIIDNVFVSSIIALAIVILVSLLLTKYEASRIF